MSKLKALELRCVRIRDCNTSEEWALRGLNPWPSDYESAALTYWAKSPMRRERDSNPRNSLELAGFQDRCVKPTPPSLHIFLFQSNYTKILFFFAILNNFFCLKMLECFSTFQHQSSLLIMFNFQIFKIYEVKFNLLNNTKIFIIIHRDYLLF